MEIVQPGIIEEGVTSINSLTGDVILAAGAGVLISTLAQTITISAPQVGTVTSIASADGSITVTNPTAAVDLAVVKSPKLTTARTISITGDLTYTSPSFDGSGNVTGTGTLASIISAGGPTGSATVTPIITYDAKGRLTAVSSATITPAASSITGGAALTKADDTNVTLTLGGSPSTSLLTASSLTLGWTGTLAVSRGGTGGGSASITLFNNITGFSAAGTTGTTSTNLVFSTSPVFITPTLGVASATSLATSAASPLLLTNGQLVTIALTSQTVGGTTLTIPNFASVSDTFTFNTLAATLLNKTLDTSVGKGTWTASGTWTLPAHTVGGTLTISAQNIATDTTTGTKIGTATNQKIGFFNSTPIVQPTGDVITGLQNLGLMASATITATTNANLTGPITSVGNATSIASQTGTGTKFVVDTSPTIITPTFTTNFTSPIWKPAADSTTAISINKSNGTTNVVTVDTTNSRLGVGTTSPTGPLDVGGWTGIPADINGASANVSGDLFVGNTGATTGRFRQASNGNQGFISWNSYFNVSAALVQMDTTKAAWIVNMVGGGGDYTSIERQPPGGGAFVPIAYFASTGNVKLGGAVRGTTEGTNHLDMFNGTAPAGTLANGFSIYSASGQMQVMDSSGNVFGLSGSKVGTYNNIATVSNGVPSELATVDSTGLTANVGATTIYAVPASGAGMYRVCSLVVETTAGSISSTLPNVQILYTDNQTGGVITIDATPVLGVAGIGQTGALTANTVGTTSTGVIVINAKASTNIQYQTVNYASNLAGMAYALHVLLEKL